MSGLLNDKVLGAIKNIKKVFLWVAVFILIGELIAGAILILTAKFDLTIGKLMGTFALCGIVLFVGVNNFSCMEKKNALVQCFALASMITNIVWLTLAILFIWEVVPFIETSPRGFYYSSTMTVLAKVMLISLNIATMCFLNSNVWSIEETLKPVLPLKITAIVCESYCGIYGIVVTLGQIGAMYDSKWYALAALAGLAFIVMAIAASLVSKSGKKKSGNVVDSKEMQATIQEMVEKEVQQRLQAQANNGAQNATPVVQTESQPEAQPESQPVAQPEDQPVAQPEGQPVAQPENQPEQNQG